MELTIKSSDDFIERLIRESKKEGITINIINKSVESDKQLMTAKDLKSKLKIGDAAFTQMLVDGLPTYQKTGNVRWFYYPEVIEFIKNTRRI